MKSYKNMTADEYSQIKLFLSTGLSRSNIKMVTGRSLGTIQRIADSKDFDGYKESVRDAYKNAPSYQSKKKPAQATQSVADFLSDDPLKNFPSIHKETNEVKMLKQSYESRQVVALEKIADRLEDLVKAWENEPAKKRGIF